MYVKIVLTLIFFMMLDLYLLSFLKNKNARKFYKDFIKNKMAKPKLKSYCVGCGMPFDEIPEYGFCEKCHNFIKAWKK